jgi:hypothetical protein
MAIASHSSPHDVVATTRRVLLAWYLDFLLYSVVATLASFSASWLFGSTWTAQLVGFVVVRSVIGRFIETPGMMLLGIRRDGTRDAVTFQHESWLTMLIGTLFMLDGAKRAIRWTQYDRALPDFGVLPDETGQMVLSLAWGIAFMMAGCLILRMQASGLWLGIALAAAGLASVALSWPLWDDAIARELAARRALQARTIGADEIEFIQRFVPLALVLVNLGLLGVLAGIRRRFRTG